jgi:two-component system chemotaxis response regulator CheB
MIVDDSAVIRGFFRRLMDPDDAIEVVAAVGNGKSAIDSMKRVLVDVVVLDIEMPVMDGLTALPQLLEIDPTVKIIMASTLTVANADVSLRAMSMGAADYVAKPTSTTELHSADDFQRELLEKIKALGSARRGKATTVVPEKPAAAPKTSAPVAKQTAPGAPITLRRAPSSLASILAIGSSTGGPQALLEVLGGLQDDFELPILITQHMPATFTGILAEHITKATGRDAKEAVDGEVVTPGRIYIAPGDFHMIVEPSGTDAVIRLNQDPPENFCRPAVDVMLRSLSANYGNHLLTVILTGMGQDGLIGCQAVIEAEGTVIAQDEETSVVWGMPGAVANAGVCSAILPLKALAAKICEFSGRPVA